MGHHRRDYAHQVDVITCDNAAPIAFNMRDAKLGGRCFCVSAMSAGDGDNLYSRTVCEARNLRRARESCAHDTYANGLIHRSFNLSSQYRIKVT